MEVVRALHLLAMGFFVGGQLVLAAAIVPVLRGDTLRPQLRAIARRFGYGSLVALAVLVVTGSWMAGDLSRWDDGTLHVKLGLVGAVVALVVWHIVRPRRPVIDVLILVGSLAIVWLGVDLAH
jgi:putative copper export protein